MCKKNVDWITVLSDWGYDVQIIEQTMHTSSGDSVKPDVVTASNVLLHSLVFEMKGGKSIREDQLQRYASLAPSDLRWVTVYDRDNLRMDVCICDFAENHPSIRINNNLFPMLTFSQNYLFKEGNFKLEKLNEIFREPISLKGKLPPLSYYPFSEEDEQSYIAIHVIRTILSLALKNRQTEKERSSEDIKDQVIDFEDVVASKFNYVWKVLSDSHKKALKTKITEVTRIIFANEEIRESLGIIQQRKGYKITQKLEQFHRQAIRFIEELESKKGQKSLTDYPHSL
jgi:hypothetical protein